MNQTSLSAFIWSVADLLRGDYKQSEYGKVILPFTVLRRLDCVLESTKDAVLPNILGYTPHSRVHIEYVPSLDDQKTAWDFIHFRGFLGAKMSLQFIWQGFDSILAAPLVLDLARLAELAKRRGESGLMPHLASFFKAPLGVGEHRLHEQFVMLTRYVDERRPE